MSSFERGSVAVGLDKRGAFAAFYDATCGAAHSLAWRVTGDDGTATSACEAAYMEHWRTLDGAPNASFQAQTSFLQVVRLQALRARPRPSEVPTSRSDGRKPTYTQAELVRAKLQDLDAFTRRTLEMAYFGGLTVADIAEVAGRSPLEIRKTLRTALLTMGAPAQHEETGR